MSIGAQAELIVEKIIQDLRDRKGLGDVFDEMDSAVLAELEGDWMLITRRILERG